MTTESPSPVLTTLRFEPLREDHILAILAIEKTANTAPWSDKSFRNELDNPHGVFRVAIVDGEVVGYGGVWLVVDEAHVTTIAVAESHRRLGIGRRLMVELLKLSRERDMVCSTLEVRAGNEAAIHLYERLGYERTAIRKAYYPDNREDAVVMWLYELDRWEPPRS
jgi:[ribosomal protein S18]-alanine N-acetyltransferase